MYAFVAHTIRIECMLVLAPVKTGWVGFRVKSGCNGPTPLRGEGVCLYALWLILGSLSLMRRIKKEKYAQPRGNP